LNGKLYNSEWGYTLCYCQWMQSCLFCSLDVLVNPLKTKCRLLYLKAHSVPRCKHFSSRL
jgi:hypothetical protein